MGCGGSFWVAEGVRSEAELTVVSGVGGVSGVRRG